MSATMMFTTTILVLVVSTLSILFASTIYSFSLSVKTRLKGRPPLPPGSLGLPIIGELFSFLSNPSFFITSRHAKYGRVFKSNVFGPSVFLESPAGNKFLFNNEGKLLHLTSASSIETLVGLKSLVFRKGDLHKLARRHLTPFLEPVALAQHVPRIERHTKNHLAEHWQPNVKTQNGEEFEISVLKSARKLAYYIMTDLIMSSDANETDELRKLHDVWVPGLYKIPIKFPGSPYHRALKARTGYLATFGKIIARRKVELAEGKASPTQDLLSYLLTEPDDTGKTYTDEEIMDNLLMFLFAGHDTVTSVITTTLRFISLYPDIQQRLKEEHDAVAKRKNDGKGLTKEDVWGMKYTWQVIQESMRRNTVIRMGFREAIEDFEYDGFTIMKGWKLIWTSHFHMDAKYFKDPDKFDPTRFNGENEIIPYSYVPFGSGPRTCFGNEFARMEMVIVIYYVMRNYTFTLVDPDEPVIYAPFPVQKSGTLMKVKMLDPGML